MFQEVESAFADFVSTVVDKAADPTCVASTFAMFWKAISCKE